MENRFNAEKNPLVFNFNFELTDEAESALYFIANLMYRDFTEREVKNVFSDPKLLAAEVADMLYDMAEDDSYKDAVITASFILLSQFSK